MNLSCKISKLNIKGCLICVQINREVNLKQNVIIETVKEAEDGDGVIIRLYESENARTKAHISFEKPVASVESCDCVEKTKETVCVAGDGFDITIKPYEIQTYRVRF